MLWRSLNPRWKRAVIVLKTPGIRTDFSQSRVMSGSRGTVKAVILVILSALNRRLHCLNRLLWAIQIDH
jgi:hypothetical protein